ncbi:MAG: DUF1904 family protein [Sedimentibacter sp.]|uniref:DUF1904 family protein n=1 Tax=Sedimentibacter sp. TaxID=1960295 RepID=UPI003158E392
MPALRFRAIDASKILEISKELTDELQELIQCPRSYFTLEVVQSRFITDGQFVEGPASVDVFWFDRGQEIQDKTAEIITRYINSSGYESVDIIFHTLEENRYYENGEHF